MAAGKLTANIAHTLTLDEAAEAHRLQETDSVGGKIVLTL
ncbi:MAG: zinc-binding dehydrogenase [Planctomycetota bacterium]